MTTLLSALSLQLDADHGPLFTNLSFTLRMGDRIGLLGHNGSGKTTLLDILAGHREPSGGRLNRAAACRLQYVEQQLPESLAALTVREVLLAGIDPADSWRIDPLLSELQLDPAGTAKVSELSGGQHSRVMLARALLHDPDLLLLDEPSNHLDLPSLLWLETFLLNWKGGFVLVSHDARLLDTVTRQSWILRDQQLYCFDLPCSAARLALAEADRAAGARRAAEQKEIDRLTTSSRRLAIWGREHDNEKLLRQARSMERRIDALKDEQTFVSRGSPWRLQLDGAALEADSLLVFEQLPVYGAPDAPALLCLENLKVGPTDKIAVLGANGSGKSSLLRQCWQAVSRGETPSGWRYHRMARIAYYDQSQQRLPEGDSLPEALYGIAPLPETVLRHALIRAGFPYARHPQKVATLSGGERARLLLLGISLASHHMVWLDEPTNHLDIEGKEQLTEALQGFAGSFLLVSHDRELIEACCQRFWVIRDGRLEEWLDAAAAYRALAGTPSGHSHVVAGVAEPEANPLPGEEAMVQRLCELEALLAADLARKARHRKPYLQAQWREEMQRLTASLGW